MKCENRQSENRAFRRHELLMVIVCVGLAAGIFIAYEPVRLNDFVNYDDNVYITENPNVNKGITAGSLIWALTQFHDEMWHPLTTLSHLLDCQLYGLQPLGHHITNLLIHLANALLLFFILRKLNLSLWTAAFIGAVFALHPLQVEPVAWASERKTVLAGLFSFLTIAVYLWYINKPGIKRYIPLLLIYTLCIMTKPSVVILPFILLLLDYWPLERFKLNKTEWLISEKVPLIALAAILSVLTLIAQKHGGVIVPVEGLAFKYRIGNAFLSYMTYILNMIYPAKLALLYPHPFEQLPIAPAIISTLLFIVITILAFYIGLKKKYVLMGWLWFAGSLVPMIGIVQSGVQSMADRYMYLSMLGLLFIIVPLIGEIIAKYAFLKPVAVITACVIIVSMILMTRIQVRYWQNGLTLFEHTLKVTQNNAIAETNYGSALFKAGRFDESIEHFDKALKIVPAYSVARNNLGKALLKQGKAEQAIDCFNSIPPDSKEADQKYANLGAAYTILGKFEPAYENLVKAKELNPDDPDVLNNLAWLLAAVRESQTPDNNSIEYAKHACDLTGYKNADYLDTMAVTYAANGQFAEAIEIAQKAIDIAKSQGNDALAKEIQNRLELYKNDKPYNKK